jgi:uncharacterized protein YggU (UPF0235/DUF167 family)
MYLRVIVSPDSKKDTIVKKSEDTWQMTVREPAEQNRANDSVRTLVAQELSIAVSKVRILTGHRSRSKMLSIDI